VRRLLVLALLLTAAGCATNEGASTSSTAAFASRAAAIESAWHGALSGPAGQAWHTGLVPLQDLTVAPSGLTTAAQTSITWGWYVTGADLPTAVPTGGQVRFSDGGTLPVPLLSAADAYHGMRRGDPHCDGQTGTTPASTSATSGPVGGPATQDCAVLTVVGARFGQTTLRTSRGEATVPAWLFTVRELAQPVARVAFDPAAVTPVPYPDIPALPGGQQSGLAGAVSITNVGADRLEFTIGIGACDRDPVGLVSETADAVVIGGSDQPATGSCIGSLLYQPVSITLAQPLGTRAVFDVVSGRPLTPRP
jgi:hypothetical protein